MDIKKIVIQLMKKYATNDPFELSECLGIKVLYHDLGHTWGYFSTYKRFKAIHINQKLSEEHIPFTCAHELGHAVLHKGIATNYLKAHTLFSVDKIEREAHMFAVELILPDYYLKENSCFGLYRLAEMHGIPQNLARLKYRGL